MSGPLAGLRVLNFGWVWAGPAAGHTLAEFGAEVIRIESAARKDISRRAPPHLHRDPEVSIWGVNVFRSQVCASLNLGHPEAADVVLRLAEHVDIVIENFVVGALAAKGITYERLAERNPALVYVSLSPAGNVGPYASMRGFGDTVTAMSGLDSLQGYGDDPETFSQAYTDGMVGNYAAMLAAAAALRARRTGVGCCIDLAQTELALQSLVEPLIRHGLGQSPRRGGNHHYVLAPHGVYPCAGDDVWIAIAVRSDAEWQRLDRALGLGLTDSEVAERFATALVRKAHEAELDEIISRKTSGMDRDALAHRLQGEGIAATPVLSAEEMYQHPHYVQRDSFATVDMPGGPAVIYGLPWKLSRTPGAVRFGTRAIGQDNDYVYRDLAGLGEPEYRRLRDEGCIA